MAFAVGVTGPRCSCDEAGEGPELSSSVAPGGGAHRGAKGEAADSGEIANFPGVSAPYAVPANADLVLPTHEQSIADGVEQIIALLEEKQVLG